MATLERAVEIAMEAHDGQIDKGGRPYIAHPLRMVAAALDAYDDEDIAIVAALHDVVEDTGTTLDALLLAGFSPKVIDAIDALTKRPAETYKQALFRAKSNGVARVVKMLDNLDNSQPSRIDRIPDRATRDRLATKYAQAGAFLAA